MTITKCNKCGKEIRSLPISAVKFPMFKILLYNNIWDTHEIELCRECTDKLVKWLDDGTDEQNTEERGLVFDEK